MAEDILTPWTSDGDVRHSGRLYEDNQTFSNLLLILLGFSRGLFKNIASEDVWKLLSTSVANTPHVLHL